MNAAHSSSLRFRPMRIDDVPEIMAIEETAYAYPWTREIFKDCLRVGHRCRVLDLNGYPDAYGVMALAADEAHLLNLCVRPALQGYGLARRLLQHLLQLAYDAGSRTMLLEVRPSNTPARRLYSAAGFCELGVRPNYYPSPNGREDALLMAKELITFC